MILMSSAVGQVVDGWIIWEEPRFIDEGSIVWNRLVDVELVIPLPGVGSDVGDAESGVPSLVLDRQVVLHAVRHLYVRADRGRDADGGRPPDALREDAREDDDGGVLRIVERRFVDREGSSAGRFGARHDIVKDAESGADHRVVPPRAIRQTDARREVVPVGLEQTAAIRLDQINVIPRHQGADLTQTPLRNHYLAGIDV